MGILVIKIKAVDFADISEFLVIKVNLSILELDGHFN